MSLSYFYTFKFVNTTTNNITHTDSGKNNEFPYEYIDQITRFNKKDGSIEYYVKLPKAESICGNIIFGLWLNKESVLKKGE